MIFFNPEQGVSQQEIGNFVAPVVIDFCAPIFVFAFTGIGVFIKGRSVKLG